MGEVTPGRSFAHREAELRGEHDVVPVLLYGADGDLLGETLGVHVRRVYEVAPCLDEAVGDSLRGLLAGLVAEGHRTEAQLRYHESRPAQLAILHVKSLLYKLCRLKPYLI
jgi:hypothetical protein